VKVCLIAPDSMLHQKMDMDFVLAHRLIQSRKYMNHYARANTFKILDNGAYENDKMDMWDILRVADEISAAEIILPDTIMRRMPKEFYEELIPSLPKGYQYQVIPQGSTPMEWREAYLELCDLDGVDTIGIPIWLSKEFGSRPNVVLHMFRKGELNLSKNHHLLGLDNYWELIMYPPGLIRSVDTSLPFSMAASKVNSSMYMEPEEHKRVKDNADVQDLDLKIFHSEKAMLRAITRLV